jgi:thioredoxin reductase (NADPH)
MYDVAIVGGGPAGASAAIFTARAGLSTLVIDADKGWTRRAMLNNHLGFPEGITGPDLVDRGRQHATGAGAEWVDGSAASIERRDDGLVVQTDDGTSYEATSVLLTTGINVSLAKAMGAATRPGTEPHVNEVITVDADGRTNVTGLWAAGTAAGVSVHTIITAGDGARVAINLISAAKGERWADHDVMPRPAQ